VGSQAVRSILDKARSEDRGDVVHAFPPVANDQSNAMCQKMGFSNLGECEFEFRDRILQCNHWQLNLKELVSG